MTVLPALLALVACKGGDSDSDLPVDTDPQEVAIDFAGRVGSEAFACGTTYEGVGSSGTTLRAADFRLYVHDVRLILGDGSEVPLDLDQDGMWQFDNLAMLDFEDGSGDCANGTAPTNAQIKGMAPPGEYTGVRFTLGVPFALNHQDASVAPSPLNSSSMFWNWEGGYKFFRFDGFSTGQPDGFFFHLGSTGCVADGSGVVTSCANPNLFDVTVDGYTPGTGAIAVDLAALTAGVDLDAGTATCMSDPAMGGDCPGWFASLALSPGQTVFKAE